MELFLYGASYRFNARFAKFMNVLELLQISERSAWTPFIRPTGMGYFRWFQFIVLLPLNVPVEGGCSPTGTGNLLTLILGKIALARAWVGS